MIKNHLLKQLFGFLLLTLLCFTLTSAKRGKCRARILPLTSIHIVDRNGLSETISGKERLGQFQLVDFLKNQPYQKVLRIFARDSIGNIRSVVTTYYENGNIKQILEIVNGRAFGNYCEWHENGLIAINANVIGGTPDVTPLAEKTWLFDGISYAYTEQGEIKAKNSYSQGFLEGTSYYYHENGQIWKKIPYCNNKIEGKAEIFNKNGDLFQQMNFEDGKLQGTTTRYWDCGNLASCENYCHDNLQEAQYYDKNGELITEIKKGNGYRAVFSKDHVVQLQEFVNGVMEGEIRVFNCEGRLKRIYRIKNGIKHGDETEYYDDELFSGNALQPKLFIQWHEGKMQGISRTWYPNGVIESQKEMANNDKNGLSTIWYRDGNLMMIEEYEVNKLVRGDYFRKDDQIPTSQVIQGKGKVTIFDADGHFVQKINYSNGKPEL